MRSNIHSLAPVALALSLMISAGAQTRTLEFPPSLSEQDMLEVGTAVRSISEVQLVVDTERKTLTLDGTPQQIAVAEWTFAQLRDANAASSGTRREYAVPGSANDLVEVLSMDRSASVRQLQEVATLIRTTGEIRKAFTYNAPRVVVFRGTPDQMNLAVWLFQDLNTPAADRGTGPHQYQMDGQQDVVRVFYVPQADTAAQLQSVAVKVRTATKVRRLFTYNEPRAIALRGTADQIAMAERLLAGN